MDFQPLPIFSLPDEVKEFEALINRSHETIDDYLSLRYQIESTPSLSGYRNHLLKLLDQKFNK